LCIIFQLDSTFLEKSSLESERVKLEQEITTLKTSAVEQVLMMTGSNALVKEKYTALANMGEAVEKEKNRYEVKYSVISNVSSISLVLSVVLTLFTSLDCFQKMFTRFECSFNFLISIPFISLVFHIRLS
jgi:hypothetical protein